MPEGTVVSDMYTGEVIAELYRHGDRFLAAAGGRGGRGNAKFLSNRRRAPSFAEQGEHGEERWLKLEIQLMADVALVGFPNVGKSTLISVVSAAKPKIADYPFTTLEPHLGVVRLDDATELVVADIPGLIEGASEGKGLGHQFLRHVERARVLCLLVDLAPMDGTSGRPNRSGSCSRSSVPTSPTCSIDRDSSSARRPTWCTTRRPRRRSDGTATVISAVTGHGVRELVGKMAALVHEARQDRPRADGLVVIRPDVEGAIVERARRRRVPPGRPRRRACRRAQRRDHPDGARPTSTIASSGWACSRCWRTGRCRRGRRGLDRGLQLRVPTRPVMVCTTTEAAG